MRTAALDKESAIISESRIGQDETDRLFSFAKKCSDIISSMNYTETALNKYRDTYIKISDELKKGSTTAEFSSQKTIESLFAYIPEFSPEAIEREMITREILSREGLDSLSGSITLVQYYKRKGIPIKFTPTSEEIIFMKKIFMAYPEITVSSWRMNGKNFRQIDINVTAELKKLFIKNAWNNNRKNNSQEIFNIAEAGINVSFNPPSGWIKIPDQGSGHILKVSFESPDRTGVIEVTAIPEEKYTLQILAGLWPEKQGFAMIEKNWGKKDNSDFMQTVAKNSYDGVMESYMLIKKGHVIILSGKSTGNMYRKLNRALSEIFKNLEIIES